MTIVTFISALLSVVSMLIDIARERGRINEAQQAVLNEALVRIQTKLGAVRNAHRRLAIDPDYAEWLRQRNRVADGESGGGHSG